MSEFSDSYHLRSNDRNEGVNLLKRAGLKGFVFPGANGWVTLVAEGILLIIGFTIMTVFEAIYWCFAKFEKVEGQAKE